ncbi:MAG: hypothetical protein M1831_000332 [Alyxoria varia]|nr:MAG: hypothetical protein M1831_000332 [Alyxoria varia]
MDDDSFDDTDFDQLPPNTLQELEQRARFSTQQKAPQLFPNASSLQPIAERNNVPNENGESFAEDPPSDYGLDDEDVIDLDAQPPAANPSFPQRPVRPVPDEVTHREQWRQQRYGAPPQFCRQPQSRNTPFVQPFKNGARPPASQATEQNGYHQPSQPTQNGLPVQHISQKPQLPTELMDPDMLQARIAELEQESADLRKESENARNLVFAKTGEISIVRSNQDKLARDYERRITELQRQHSEDVARQKAELETARKAREKVETSNRFLEHDLAQEAERAKTSRKAMKGPTTAEKEPQSKETPTATPKKNKALPFRDGFNDDEVMMLTPSKYREKAKQGTPKAGSKRKRAETKSQKSPSKPLSFHEPVASPAKDDGLPPPPFPPGEAAVQAPLLVSQDIADEKFDFTQMILDHRLGAGHDRTLEVMSTHFLPSKPTKSFASVMYDAFSHPSISDFTGYRQHFCEVILDLWSSCLEEQYYAPLPELPTLLQHILMTGPSNLYAALIPRLVPLCFHTADIIAIPTAKHSKNPLAHPPPPPEHYQHIDPIFYLEFFQQIVTECELLSDQGSPAALETFWSSMEFDFVLLMLHRSQPLEQILMMLQLLSSSILPNTFGAIVPPEPSTRESTATRGATASTTTAGQHPSRQAKSQSDILDRLTLLLFETPEPPRLIPDPNASEPKPTLFPSPADPHPPTRAPPYPPPTLLKLRTRLLALLQSLCLTPHGGRLLSTHRLAIGQLVRFLHDSILHLYAYTPETHTLISDHVNRTVAMLAHATSVHADVVDLRRRLASVGMGEYKFLVGLGRCAFAECGGDAVDFAGGEDSDSSVGRGEEEEEEEREADVDMHGDRPAAGNAVEQKNNNAEADTNMDADPESDKRNHKSIRGSLKPAQSLLESRIWIQTADEAHRMLDEWLTPAEGEAVVGVLGSAGAASGGTGGGGGNAVSDGGNAAGNGLDGEADVPTEAGHDDRGGGDGEAVDEDEDDDDDDDDDDEQKEDLDGDTPMTAAK